MNERLVAMVQLAWRRLRWPLVVLVLYLVAELLFVWLSADTGLFLPMMVSGDGLGVLLSGAVLLVFRVAVYGLLPAVLVYKLVGLVWLAMIRPEK